MGITEKTVLTDRQLLVHLLEHVEVMAVQLAGLAELAELAERFRPLLELAERHRPLLERLDNGGSPFVGMARAGKGARRGSSRT
jgi:hypothetical protein